MLQSGSFFTPALDPQESGYAFFDRSSASSLAPGPPGCPGFPEVAMTCGTAEENLANNRLLRDHLREVGMTSGGARCVRATPGCAGATPSTRI